MEGVRNDDKQKWCEHGRELEDEFVLRQRFVDVLIGINPDKDSNPFTYDMRIDLPCDLKSTKTPWRKAQEMFGIDPRYAVSINQKDLRRYARLYPNIVIVFDVDYPNYRATHWATLDMFRIMLEGGDMALHQYGARVDDTQGNAKASYVFDVSKLPRLRGYDEEA
jgi:hypothetical protein